MMRNIPKRTDEILGVISGIGRMPLYTIPPDKPRIVFDLHGDDGADACEAVDHYAD
jgi:hypothetical protein